MSRRTIVVRHGETAWSRTGQHTGRTDLELTAHGRDEAVAAGSLVRAGCGPSPEVRTSPLRRARDTTAALALPVAAVEDERLVEWDYGELEGQTKADIRTELGAAWSVATGPIPGGEQLADVVARADAVAASLTAPVTVLVTHGHLGKVLVCRLLALPPEQLDHLDLASGGVAVLDDDPAVGWRLTSWERPPQR